jgi:hypothetical protein
VHPSCQTLARSSVSRGFVMFGLASSSAATDRVGSESCTSMHSGVGAARHGVLRGVQLSSPGSLRAEGVTGEQLGFYCRALRHRSTAAPRPRAIHSCSCPQREQHEYGPNLKYEHKDQHNAQPCGLGRLAWSGFQSRLSCTEPQFNQRANPSFKRTCLRHAA